MSSDQIEAVIRHAKELMQAGKYERAIAILHQTLQSHPHNIEVLRRYGNALAGIKRYEEAFRAFEQALQLKPNNSKVFKDYIYALSSSDQQEKVLPFLEHLLNTEPQNYKIFHSYAIQLNSTFKYSKALPFFKYLVKIEPDNPDILYTYVGLLHSNGENEKALLCLDKLLQMEPNNVAALMGYLKILPLTGQYEKTGSFQKKLLHTLVLEIRHKYQEAINQLAVIKIEDLTPYQANVIRVNLGRLYYRIKESEKGNEYFEAAITNSDDKERTLLDSARSILANDPHSDKAVEMLQQIAETSPRYAQAFEMLTLYLSEEDYFDMVKTHTQSGLSDTEVLNRAMYHKIANEISILKGIAYRISRRAEQKDPLLSGIIQDIEDVFEEVDRRRAAQKSEIETIPHHDYKNILAVISKTAHDISDFVNNQLAVIESKTRRAMRKLKPDDAHYTQFEKLLIQLELTQTALSDLKAINEGITIKNNRFKVKKLFEKWEITPTIEQAQIVLDIQNGNSEFNGDEEKIKSALNELVGNSLKHNSEQQNLTISMTSQDVINPPGIRGRTIPGAQKYLFIEFADNGKGVPAEKKDWIFQPLKTTSQEGKGSGLGLFIIRKTLTKMSGYIRETGGNGARFEIYIPYIKEETD